MATHSDFETSRESLNQPIDQSVYQQGQSAYQQDQSAHQQGLPSFQQRQSSPGARLVPTQQKPLTVLWALDPFATEDLALQEKVAEVIASISPKNARIFPVYALARDGLNWNGDYNRSTWAEDKTPEALNAIDALIAQMTDRYAFQTEDIRPTVLAIDESSHTKAVHQLTRFAKQVHADIVAVGSHGTSNIMQLLTGSFVEAFMSEAQLPLLIVNSNNHATLKCCDSLVFATDFSPACLKAFETILPLAKAMNADIHLFHRAPNTLDPLVQGGVSMFGGGWVSIDAYVGEHQERRSEEGLKWVERAKAFGVQAQWIAYPDRGPLHETTAAAVLEYASAQTNPMIVVAPQSAPVASILFGSVTKDIIRGASCPVFVVPSRA